MKVRLSAAGKRFNYDWIFRNVSLEFNAGTAYAITGPNGSGKSTLLQTIGGMLQLSEGSLSYQPEGSREVPQEEAYRQVAFCAPYIDLVEEMTLEEFLHFHARFKPFLSGLDPEKIIELIGLSGARSKQIRYYSSGMKQRVKLAQAIFSQTPLLLLDEPCSNLDITGIELYHSLIGTYGRNRLIIVCSNDPVEYRFCTTILSMTDFKPSIVPA